MTTSQWKRVEAFLWRIFAAGGEWHDGDCIGADHQAHIAVERIREDAFIKPVHMVGHPSNHKLRAWNDFDEMRPVKAPITRNRDIVDSSSVIAAAPKEYEEVIRGSGTWATIRYARLNKKPLFIFWPDGTLDIEGLD